MSDDRTDRQRAADEALELAIREVRAADHEAHPGEEGWLSEWVLIGMEVGSNDDGGWSRYFRITPDGGDRTPPSHVLGLLHHQLVTITARIHRVESGEEE